MRDQDFDAFGELLDATCSLLSRGAYKPTGTNTALWFRALAAHDLDTVRAGFDAHIRDPERGCFVPNPADVIRQIERLSPKDARPGADEAWSIALGGANEWDTVVWTTEIRDALAIAQPVLDTGDKVGARFAFRSAYERLVDQARVDGRPVEWSVSVGFNAEQRRCVIERAVKRGLLPESELIALPAPNDPRSDRPLLQLVAPVEGESPAAQAVKAKLRAIAQELRAS